MYRHKVLRLNYTSYDFRRCQDSSNPRTHPDVMVLSDEEDEDNPYWYARVIGIYHVNVHLRGQSTQRINFLWVRWFGPDTNYKSGWKAKRLPRIGFMDADDPCAFSFIDPASIIRAVHLIPTFYLGKTNTIMGPSIARPLSENNEDWWRYYVNL